MIERFANNPLISPKDVTPSRAGLEVMCAFNAGATLYQGQTLLLVRVAERPVPEAGWVSTVVLDPDDPTQLKTLRVRRGDPDLDDHDPRVFRYRGQNYLTSISHLRLATSADGRHFTVAPTPTLFPTERCEEYGIEDARITQIAGAYYINYSAISTWGVCTCWARTTDFVRFERLGVMFPPHNKDIAVFPEPIGARYYCFHRPDAPAFGTPNIWLASSDNLRDWGSHRLLLQPRPGAWDAERVGCGPAPIKTPAGWLEIYHGADHHIRYCSGALLLDLAQPWRVLARSAAPIMEPTAPYERAGLMPNVVFCNGHVVRPDGSVDLYYGAADTTTCGARLDVPAVLASLRAAK